MDFEKVKKETSKIEESVVATIVIESEDTLEAFNKMYAKCEEEKFSDDAIYFISYNFGLLMKAVIGR